MFIVCSMYCIAMSVVEDGVSAHVDVGPTDSKTRRSSTSAEPGSLLHDAGCTLEIVSDLDQYAIVVGVGGKAFKQPFVKC